MTAEFPRLRGAFSRACLIAVLAVLTACSTVGGGGKEGPSLIVAIDPMTGEEIVTTQGEARSVKFFSRENLRETYFSGDTNPRLGNAPNAGPFGFLEVGRVNAGPEGLRQPAGEYFDELSAEDIIIEPLRTQPVIGENWQPRFSEAPTVELNFTDEPLLSVIQNVLGGILGVNYVTGEIEGTLTFQSERRFARAELIQMLSDVLARNGYLIQYFNGVYHIGVPEELETLTGLRGRTGLEGDETHIIGLRRPVSEDFVGVVANLVPPGNTVTQIPESNSLLVRGDPSQFLAIEEMVVSLASTGRGADAMAIFPVRNSPPEVITDQIIEIYESRGLANVLLIPVSTSPGVLAVADNNRILRDIGRLIRRLDVENTDAPQIRIVQLRHVNASELADRLTAIFAGTSVQSDEALAGEGGRTDSNIVQAAIDAANAGNDARGSDREGDSIGAPRFLNQGGAAESDGGGQAAPARVNRPSTDIAFSADTRNNALLIRSRFAEFKRIKEVVEALDIPLAQVVIEATIVEVDINDALQYGVQAFLSTGGLNLRLSDTAGAADPGGGGFVATVSTALGGTSIQGVISALQSVTNVKVISSPYLTVVDGATSRLSVGDQIPFITASQTSNSDGTVTVTQEVESRDIGVILNVTPKISPNNTVLLDIEQEVSSARNVDTAGGDNPVISQRSINSQITVESGKTILLGGLIQERSDVNENGVPVLRKIPVLGNAFNRTSNTQTRSELLVMITPRVVRNSNELSALTQQLKWWSNVNR